MKDITILDNFINDEELEEARQFIDANYKGIGEWYEWAFQILDNCDKRSIKVVPQMGSSSWRERNECIEFPSTFARDFVFKIKNKIEKYTNKKFDLERAYLNRQVCGQNGLLHRDADTCNAYTLIIYIGDITSENYDKAGGDLELKTRENLRIEPFTKRAILFKGYILHRAFAPLVMGLTRISFVFKFRCISEELPFSVNYS
jgi:hypothetical protein